MDTDPLRTFFDYMNIYRKQYSQTPFFLALILCAVLWSLTISGFCKAAGSDNAIHSDVARYIAGDDIPFSEISGFCHILSYPLYHITVASLHFLSRIGFENAAIIVQVTANVASVMILRKLLMEKLRGGEHSFYTDFVSITAMLFLAARSPLTGWAYYYPVCGPNPLHNPTILFVRPFGLMAVYNYISFLEAFKKKEQPAKPAILFSLWLLLSVAAKPSFAVMFLFAATGHILLKMIDKVKYFSHI